MNAYFGCSLTYNIKAVGINFHTKITHGIRFTYITLYPRGQTRSEITVVKMKFKKNSLHGRRLNHIDTKISTDIFQGLKVQSTRVHKMKKGRKKHTPPPKKPKKTPKNKKRNPKTKQNKNNIH